MLQGRRNDYVVTFELGDYGKNKKGEWTAWIPYGNYPIAPIYNVQEHADGTVSIASAIFHLPNKKTWAGTLINGIWKEV